jgi:3-dehydroquinate synthetase/predicted NBD/HSP70 family sugar kinase
MAYPTLPSPTAAPAVRRRAVRAASDRGYEVALVHDLAGGGIHELVSRLEGRTGLLVATPTVARLYGAALRDRLAEHGIDYPLLVLPVTEPTKDLSQVERVAAAAYEHGLDRTSILVAIGGGVVTDVVSAAGALVRRGIGVIRIPTTLIGQVDAAVGVKCAVNFAGKKSALGSFSPPRAVLIDPAYLETLPLTHLRAGFAEIVKMAVACDAGLLEMAEAHGAELLASRFGRVSPARAEMVWRSAVDMLEELEPNLFEDQTYQRRVDFGHVFSPLLEAASGYRVAHGQAVAIDVALTTRIACRLGWLDAAECDRVLRLLVRLGLPIYHPLLTDDLLDRAVAESAAHRGGCLNLVLPVGPGRSEFLEHAADLPADVLRAARDDLARMDRRVPALEVRGRDDGPCLVFDVGGTRIRAALYRGDERAVSRVHVRDTPSTWTHPAAGGDEIRARLMEAMADAGREVLDGAAPRAVGVAFPGPVGADGRVLAAPTIWGDRGCAPLDVGAALAPHWPGAPVHVLNDVSAAGYRHLRAADEDFCIVTVSSGIGNKVFIRGRPVTGAAGRGGEIGHAVVDFAADAPVCDCGGRGHLGAVASGRGALLAARRRAAADAAAFHASKPGRDAAGDPEAVTNESLVAAFRAGDGWTAALVREVSAPLGRALAGIHTALGIERFTLVGGFALALGDGYRREVARAAAASAWHQGGSWDERVELGADDDLSGLIGAGRFALEAARHG